MSGRPTAFSVVPRWASKVTGLKEWSERFMTARSVGQTTVVSVAIKMRKNSGAFDATASSMRSCNQQMQATGRSRVARRDRRGPRLICMSCACDVCYNNNILRNRNLLSTHYKSMTKLSCRRSSVSTKSLISNHWIRVRDLEDNTPRFGHPSHPSTHKPCLVTVARSTHQSIRRR